MPTLSEWSYGYITLEELPPIEPGLWAYGHITLEEESAEPEYGDGIWAFGHLTLVPISPSPLYRWDPASGSYENLDGYMWDPTAEDYFKIT